MGYVAPSVGPAGLTIPAYEDILESNLQGYLNIFGANQYVGDDSAIYELLSIISLKTSDVMQAIQLAYNQTSPATAVGAGLDRVVKLNGLARMPATASTVALTLTGTVGAVITNGIAQDGNGNQWALPASVTIPSGGTITVTAACTVLGMTTAEPSTITIIATPTDGWLTVTNSSAATPGTAIEADSALRARQAISVALPSQTRLQSTLAAVLAVPGVVRVNPGSPTPGGPGSSIENPTGSTDSWGNPAHSISMVVSGGTDAAVAFAIYLAHGIGCLTNGSTTVSVTDPVTGYVMSISFYRPTEVPIFVGIQLNPLTGYSSAYIAAVQTAIVNYLNGLAIGELVTRSALFAVAMSVVPNLLNPAFAVEALTLDTTATGAFTATVASGGSSYVVNDVITVVQGGASGGTFTVTSVSSGVITGLSPTATTPGTGYSVATGLATTGGTGSGATVNLTAVQPTATADISVDFNQSAQGVAANVVVAAL